MMAPQAHSTFGSLDSGSDYAGFDDAGGPSRISAVGLRVLTPVETRFVDNWSALSRAFGMGADPGRVHAVLFLAEQPMSVLEVAQMAGLEEELAADALRYLHGYQAIERKLWDDGDVSYSSTQDPWAWFSTTVRLRARREFAPILASIRDLNQLAQDAQRQGRLPRGRVERIAQFTGFVDQVAKLFETFGGAGSSKPMVSAARAVARFMCG